MIVNFEESPLGKLRIYRHPVPFHKYCVTVDPSSGGELAISDDKPGDDTAVCVRDRHTHEVVATMRGRFPPYAIKEQVYLLCWYYNEAHLAVENNAGWGAPILEYVWHIRGYTELYMHLTPTDLQGQFSNDLGWNTNTKTRPLAFSTARGVLREGKERIHCPELLHQLLRLQYVALPSGRAKEQAPTGEHDDLALAWVINVRVCAELGEPDPLPVANACGVAFIDPVAAEIWGELDRFVAQERIAGLTDSVEY